VSGSRRLCHATILPDRGRARHASPLYQP
jgi:hypothetical protein